MLTGLVPPLNSAECLPDQVAQPLIRAPLLPRLRAIIMRDTEVWLPVQSHLYLRATLKADN